MYISFIGIYVEPGAEGLIEKELTEMSAIVELYETGGPFELFVKAQADHRKGLEQMAGGILSLEGVEKTYNLVAMGEKILKAAEGSRMSAFMGLSVDRQRERDIEQEILDVQGVCALYTILHPFDLLIRIDADSEPGVFKIRDRIARIEGVRFDPEGFFIMARRITDHRPE